MSRRVITRKDQERLQILTTLETLRHDEEIFKLARIFQNAADCLTTVPVIGNHSIDIIIFGRDQIRFIEVKGPSGSLTPTEKKLKALIESHPTLTYEVMRYEKP